MVAFSKTSASVLIGLTTVPNFVVAYPGGAVMPRQNPPPTGPEGGGTVTTTASPGTSEDPKAAKDQPNVASGTSLVSTLRPPQPAGPEGKCAISVLQKKRCGPSYTADVQIFKTVNAESVFIGGLFGDNAITETSGLSIVLPEGDIYDVVPKGSINHDDPLQLGQILEFTHGSLKWDSTEVDETHETYCKPGKWGKSGQEQELQEKTCPLTVKNGDKTDDLDVSYIQKMLPSISSLLP